jgi:hypothetical protein
VEANIEPRDLGIFRLDAESDVYGNNYVPRWTGYRTWVRPDACSGRPRSGNPALWRGVIWRGNFIRGKHDTAVACSLAATPNGGFYAVFMADEGISGHYVIKGRAFGVS